MSGQLDSFPPAGTRSQMRSSALLALILCILTSACQTGRGPGTTLAPGWLRSSYYLSQNESTLLRDEARSAQQDGNREVCGALVLPAGETDAFQLIFADNESADAHSFELSLESLKRIRELARAQQADLVGSFHSHPTSDAAPGRGDLATAGVNSLILIHSVPTGQTRLWRVVLRGGEKKAREVQLTVLKRRTRGPSPLAPSPRRGSSPSSHDLRSR